MVHTLNEIGELNEVLLDEVEGGGESLDKLGIRLVGGLHFLIPFHQHAKAGNGKLVEFLGELLDDLMQQVLGDVLHMLLDVVVEWMVVGFDVCAVRNKSLYIWQA